MVSFVVVAKEKKKREIYEKEHAAKFKIDHFDITVIEKDETAKIQSIGIEIVKQIHKKAFLKPIKSQTKLIIIEEAHLLTPEAQNALLKLVEEPPAHTHIILGTESRDALLPTILSRCQIITLEEEKQKISEKTEEELNIFIRALPGLPVGDRLKQAELLAKDKEKALVWIENLIIILRDQLIYRYSSETIDTTDTFDTLYTLKQLQSLHTILKTTNINPRFAIEHTFLSL
jgi:DNA polymerase III delta subunit-like protein